MKNTDTPAKKILSTLQWSDWP